MSREKKSVLEYKITAILIWIIIPMIWGYFLDIKHGHMGIFICRVSITTIIGCSVTSIFKRLNVKLNF